MRYRLLIGAVGASMAGIASAADWTFTPSVGLQEIITDNVFGTGANRQADAITQLVPGLNVVGQGARVQLGFSYQPTISAYASHTGQDRFDQNLAGNGVFTPFRELMDVDFSAFALDTAGSGSYVSPAAGGLVPLNDRVLNYGGAIGPHFHEHFGSVATLDASYTMSSSNTRQAGATNQPGPANTNNVSLSSNLLQQAAQMVIGSGDSFGFLVASGNFSHTNGSGSGANNRYTLDEDTLRTEYHLSHEYSVQGSAGYQRTHYDPTGNTQGYDNEGLTWNLGFRATPNDKSELAISYGKQQGSYNINTQLTYDLAARTLVSGSYTVIVQNQLQSTLQNQQFLTHDQFGNPIDTRTGLPFNAVNQNFGSQNTLFRDKVGNVSITHEFLRSSLALSLSDDRREPLTGFSALDESWGTTVTYSRELTPTLKGYADIGYNDHSQGVVAVTSRPTHDNYINADVSLAFAINETLTANMRYSYFKRISTTPLVGQLTNSLLIGLSKAF